MPDAFGSNATLRTVRAPVTVTDGYGDPVDGMQGAAVWRGVMPCHLRRAKASSGTAGGDGDSTQADEVIVRGSAFGAVVDITPGAAYAGYVLEVDDERIPARVVRTLYRVKASAHRSDGGPLSSWRFAVDAVGEATV